MTLEPLDWAKIPSNALSSAKGRRNVAIWQATNTRSGRYITARPQVDGLLLEAWPAGEPTHNRTVLATPFDEYPNLATQMRNLRRAQPGPWRAVSIREALGVPAIFGAVNMISNIAGSLSMKAYRNEVEMPPDDRPRIIVRPDPFTIPREFFRSTAYNKATRGESDWWIAARDGDGLALSIINMPPQEVTIEENPADLRYPIVKWRGRRIPNEDFRQDVYSREPGELRGVGPLQMCGAAISVAVESQLWAANFFASGNTTVWVKTNLNLSGDDGAVDDEGLPEWVGSATTSGRDEAQRFLDQWMEKDGNTPRITGDSVEDIQTLEVNPQGAQMLEARQHQNSEVATMFSMDAALLNAAVSGQSITYQNVGQRFDAFIRQCLRPNYLEGTEQTMSDLLPRSITARFNESALTLADIKTRYEVYGLGIDKGIIDAPEARSFEGLAPGDVENAAVPFSPPQAIPAASQFEARSAVSEVRCQNMVTKRRSGITKMAPCNALLSKDGVNPGWCYKCRQSTVAA